jgi:hypothetical protein
MSSECGECERDLRGGHDDACSKAPKCKHCKAVVSRANLSDEQLRGGFVDAICPCGRTEIEAES